MEPKPLDWSRLRVYPLAERRSLTSVDEILRDPDSPAPVLDARTDAQVRNCAAAIGAARARGAGVVMMYGAHLLRNGAAPLLTQMMRRGWLTHLATNGAGTIHDWEYASFGRSTESVRENVATGTFGSWDETGRNLMLALLAGGLRGEGYGRALGRFIAEDGASLPAAEELESQLRAEPASELAGARADLLRLMCAHGLPAGRCQLEHRWKQASILAQAFLNGVPMTVHPGIGLRHHRQPSAL